ncbi:MAG: hypothetical protein WA374_09135 [Acidobacteriaceae bacterium]
MAYPLQYPGTKLYSAVVLWTAQQGVGKSLLGYTMQQIPIAPPLRSAGIKEIMKAGLGSSLI